jgi:hypothetical protein
MPIKTITKEAEVKKIEIIREEMSNNSLGRRLQLPGSHATYLDSIVTRENIFPSRMSSTRHGPIPPRTAIDRTA